MAKEFEFPLSLIFNNRRIRTMQAPDIGALLCILYEFWINQAEIPDTFAGQARLARCSGKQWRYSGQKVKEALKEIMPSVIEAYRNKSLTKDIRTKIGINSYMVKKAIAERKRPPKHSALVDAQTDTLPQTVAHHTPPKFSSHDATAVKAATAREKQHRESKPLAPKAALSEKAGS